MQFDALLATLFLLCFPTTGFATEISTRSSSRDDASSLDVGRSPLAPCLDGCTLGTRRHHHRRRHHQQGQLPKLDAGNHAASSPQGGRSTRGSPIDLVVAHCCELLDWVFPLVQEHPGAIARVIVYSKCTHKASSASHDCDSSRFVSAWKKKSRGSSEVRTSDASVPAAREPAAGGTRGASVPTLPLGCSPPPPASRQKAAAAGRVTWPALEVYTVHEAEQSTDECGAYLTHLARFSRTPTPPSFTNSSQKSPAMGSGNNVGGNSGGGGNSVGGSRSGANGPSKVGGGGWAAEEPSGASRWLDEPAGALMVHGNPHEHWNKTLVRALLKLAAASPLPFSSGNHSSSSSSSSMVSSRGMISSSSSSSSNASSSSTFSTDHDSHHDGHDSHHHHSSNGSATTATLGSNFFMSVNSAFWHIKAWPGGSTGLAQGSCMHSLVRSGLFGMGTTLEPADTYHSRAAAAADLSRESSPASSSSASSSSSLSPSSLLPPQGNGFSGVDWRAFKESAFVREAANITAYSNAMFFVGYGVIRRRPPSFWQGVHAWMFGKISASSKMAGEEDKACRGGRKRSTRVAGSRCRLLERTWHTLFCQPCRLPPREADARLPPSLRIPARDVFGSEEDLRPSFDLGRSFGDLHRLVGLDKQTAGGGE